MKSLPDSGPQGASRRQLPVKSLSDTVASEGSLDCGRSARHGILQSIESVGNSPRTSTKYQ